MKRLGCCLLIIAVFADLHLFALDIYVATTGNDANPGTKSQPLATLKGARDAIRKLRSSGHLNEAITVTIEQGSYFMNEPLTFTIEDTSPTNSPVTFTAAPNAQVRFIGGKQITNLVKVNDKLWEATIPEVIRYDWQFEQLYVNDHRAVRARTPNIGELFSVKSAGETVNNKGRGEIAEYAVQKIEVDSSEIKSLKNIRPEDLQNAVITFYHNWDNTRKYIADFDPATATFFTAGQGMKPWNKINGESRYFIENFKEALDAPGEWFLKPDGTLYYIPREGEQIENTKLFAPVLDKFIVIKGDESSGKYVENIAFKNLTFKVAGYKMPKEGNDAVQAAAPIQAVVMVDYAKNIAFDHCEIAHTGVSAIWFRQSCFNNKITHCYLHDLGAGGVKIGPLAAGEEGSAVSKNTLVDNNIIRSGGWVFPCAAAVTVFHASDNQITHNEIADFRYSGVSVGWTWGYGTSYAKRNIVSYNHIHHLGWGELSDMGGVYTLGKSKGTIISNNNIHHIYSLNYGGWGLYTDEGSSGITMENNLVYACKSSGFHQNYGKNNTIRNNIFAFNLVSQLEATRVENHNSFSFTNNIICFNSGTLCSSNWDKIEFTSDFNCYWNERSKHILFGELTFIEWQKTGKGIHSIFANPGFTWDKKFDFKLKNKSIIRLISFKPFEYNKAGVYGSKQWIALARFDEKLAKRFNEIVIRGEANHKTRDSK